MVVFCSMGFDKTLAVFIQEDALSVQKDNASEPSLYLRCIIRLDNLGQTFLSRLVMRLQYKDGHKTHYPPRQNYPSKFVLNDALPEIVRLDS